MSARSLYRAFLERSALFLERPAVSSEDGTLTFAQLRARAQAVAGWLISGCGVQPGEVVAIVSEESLYWAGVSLGIQGACAIELPRETTISPEDFESLRRDFGFRVGVFETAETAARYDSCRLEARLLLEGSRPGCMPVAALPPATPADSAEIERRNEVISDEATASYIRTSGTTGSPKSVPLSHRGLTHMMETLSIRARVGSDDRLLSVLPPWHLYARVVQYAAIQGGAEVYYGSPADLASLPTRVRPTLFPGFPEIWEAVYHRVIATFTAHGALGLPFFWMLRWSITYHHAVDALLARERSLRQRTRTGAALHRVWSSLGILLWPFVRLADLLVFRRIRAALGGRLRVAIIGDAPLPLPVDEALRALGFVVLEGYGSTEQCVTVMRSPDLNVAGTAGRPLPDTRLRIIGADLRPVPAATIGEITVQGPQVFHGYLPAERTNDDEVFVSIDGERFLRTGDLGCLDLHGNVIVIGRRAHALRLSDGRIVYPEVVEEPLRASRLIERVVVIGQGLSLPVALIFPDRAELYRFVVGHERTPHPARPPLRALVLRATAGNLLDRPFSPTPPGDLPWDFIRPGRVVILSHPFDPKDEITPTLKPRRHVISVRYHELAVRALAQPHYVRGDFQLRKTTGRA